MTTGDGLAMIAGAIMFVGVAWATAWATVRNTAERAEALRRLGEPPTWTQSKTTTTRREK